MSDSVQFQRWQPTRVPHPWDSPSKNTGVDIIRNAGLEEAQAGIKIAGRNINNLRYAVEKAMAPHSSTLAWKIPWKEEPGRLQSMGSLRVRHY